MKDVTFLNFYFISRADDGFFYVVTSRRTFAFGPGDFQALGDRIYGPYNTRKEAETAVDSADIENGKLKIEI